VRKLHTGFISSINVFKKAYRQAGLKLVFLNFYATMQAKNL
jgi:hypothetical protein